MSKVDQRRAVTRVLLHPKLPESQRLDDAVSGKKRNDAVQEKDETVYVVSAL